VIRLSLTAGAVFGLLSVALGAFGAHGLRADTSGHLLTTWATAADYLSIHALALLAIGSLSAQRPGSRLLNLSAWAFVAGGTLFSGSLFLRVLTDERAWGAVTPFGGSILIAGWAVLALGLWRLFAPRRSR
jgi:uncharacterized membrane protein YgdD (TMEM256/DUF423 family)